MSFDRRRPSELTLRWVERSLGGGARVVAWRRMTGGIGSVVHRLTLERGGSRAVMILRQYEQVDSETVAMVGREAATLRALDATGLAAPRLLAANADGGHCDGRPTLLMTRVPGRLDLAPADPEAWVRQIAHAAAQIHVLQIAAAPIEGRLDAAAPVIPSSARRRDLWRAACAVIEQPAPEYAACFVHGDLQHFNLLWRRGRLSGIVDWTSAGTGPPDFDIGHCRLNLAVLFDADRAEQLRLNYEAESGRAVDPWWDLYAVTAYGDDWRRFIPLQVAGRTRVDPAGMTERVEHLIKATLRRL